MSKKPKKAPGLSKSLSPLSAEKEFFLAPDSPRQRQYEALRCYYVEERPVKEVAQQFGYTPGAFHALCHQFRHAHERQFFVETKPGPKYAPKRDQARALVVKLRKKHYSVQDIQYALRESAQIELSTVSIWTILNEEGFTKLPRRRDEERPQRPRPERAAYADRRAFRWRRGRWRPRWGACYWYRP